MRNPSNSHIEEASGLEAVGRKVCGMNNGSGNHKRPSIGLHIYPSVTEYLYASRLNAENLLWPEAWGSAHRLRGEYCGESLPPVIACQSLRAGVSATACEASNNIYQGLHQLTAFHNKSQMKAQWDSSFHVPNSSCLNLCRQRIQVSTSSWDQGKWSRIEFLFA